MKTTLPLFALFTKYWQKKFIWREVLTPMIFHGNPLCRILLFRSYISNRFAPRRIREWPSTKALKASKWTVTDSGWRWWLYKCYLPYFLLHTQQNISHRKIHILDGRFELRLCEMCTVHILHWLKYVFCPFLIPLLKCKNGNGITFQTASWFAQANVILVK